MIFFSNEKSACQLAIVRFQKPSIFLELFQLIYRVLKLQLQFLTLHIDFIPILLQVLYLYLNANLPLSIYFCFPHKPAHF